MLTAPGPVLAVRAARVRDAMASLGLDALVVTAPPNIAWLTNFDGSAGSVVLTGDRLYLLSDFRYSAALQALLASPLAPPATDFVCVEGSYEEAVAALVERLDVNVIGLEAAHVPWKRVAWWQARLKAELVSPGSGGAEVTPAARQLRATEGLVERGRMVKDEHEVAVLREAATRLSRVARELLAAPEATLAGRSERDLAHEIDRRLITAGFSRPAFDTIVASGPNSALPHARPTTRLVGPGDLVVLDFGGVLEGYCVDLTRTVAIGRPSGEASRLFAAVREARRRALAAVRAGVPTLEVDAAAREWLTSQGLGEAFGHGTGHGLGLEVHEEPRIGKRRSEGEAVTHLEAGMVCTIEPGVYVPGVGGVRLEDDVLVTTDGCEVLTDVPLDVRLAGEERNG